MVSEYYVDKGYYNNNNKWSVKKNEECYKKVRLLFDDGG